MSYAAFCLCHAFDVRLRLCALEYTIKRRRWVAERAAWRARTWTAVEERL